MSPATRTRPRARTRRAPQAELASAAPPPAAPRFARAVRLAHAGDLAGALRAIGSGRTEPARWLRAYVAASRGRFAAAEAVLRPLAEAAADAGVRHAAAITLGSVLRQTSRHAEARLHDRRALAAAATPAERAHASIGLAADAVGLGDVAAVRRHLAAAAAAAPREDWRARVRLDWVRAEAALLERRPRVAVRHAARALDRARGAGAARHVAKSLLFLGAAQRTAGDPDAAHALRESARLATRIGAAPIARVARALLRPSDG